MSNQNDEGGGAPFPLGKAKVFRGFLFWRTDNCKRFMNGQKQNQKMLRCEASEPQGTVVTSPLN